MHAPMGEQWMLDRYLRRLRNGCTCGSADAALTWRLIPTVQRYAAARGRALRDDDWNANVRKEWLRLSPIRRRPDVNARALKAWQDRQIRRDRWRNRVSPQLWAVVIASGPCVYCGRTADTVDHVIPQAQGGLHCRSNLAPACRSCNSLKGPRTPEQWRAGQRWLDIRNDVGVVWTSGRGAA